MTETVLYRAFNAEGDVIYIGISSRITQRTRAHDLGSHWFDDVVRIELEHHPTREEALAAEATAIGTEKPRHNVCHQRPSKVAPEVKLTSAKMLAKSMVEEVLTKIGARFQ